MYAEVPIIQKTYDLVHWYVPILNRLPRDHKFMLGNRMIQGLYEVLELFIQAQYAKPKLRCYRPPIPRLRSCAIKPDSYWILS